MLHFQNVYSISQRLQSFGMTKSDSFAFSHQISVWEKNSGTQWTIDRLKSYKQVLIHLHTDQEGQNPFRDSPWIKHTEHRVGGPIGAAFKLPFRKAIACLMVYTTVVFPSTTKTQLAKFIKGVNSPFVDISSLMAFRISKVVEAEGLVASGLWNMSKHDNMYAWSDREVKSPMLRMVSNTFKSYSTSPRHVVDSFTHPLVQPYIASVSTFLRNQERYFNTHCTSMGHLASADSIRLYKGNLQKEVGHLERVQAKASFASYFARYSNITPDDMVGSIGFIQEPGGKLRTIANPLPCFQILLSRMGKALYKTLRFIEEDCTFDQEKGVSDIQKALLSGERLSALDLSSATDMFPFSFTEKVLSDMRIPDVDIQLFKTVSRGTWQLPDGTHIKWTNGQPLGVYPSFAAFALSHHVLLKMVAPSFYRILGDDVVLDYDASLRLRELYASLGMIISEDKSLDSEKFTEFGGRLISKTEIIVQPKWKEISDRSFVDFARSIGPRVTVMLSDRQRAIVDILAEIPRDASPYGLGWNNSGKSYNTRISENAEAIKLLSNPILVSKSRPNTHIFNLIRERFDTTYREYPIDRLRLEVKDLEELIAPLELRCETSERILIRAGVISIDTDPDNDESSQYSLNWSTTSKNLSDPRGLTTLQILETKLATMLGLS